MKISFDLDGVIVEGNHHYVFRILDIIRGLNPEAAEIAEMDFYSSSTLKHRPSVFLSKDDEAAIITCRKPESQGVTEDYLKKHEIRVRVIFADKRGEIDWSSPYKKASKKAARLKAKAIRDFGSEVHFDNNPIMVKELRKLCPETKIILVNE